MGAAVFLDKLSRKRPESNEPDPAEASVMTTMTIGEIKARFSQVLESVRRGETIVVAYGKRRERVAAIVPYRKVVKSAPRHLGVLKGKGRCRIARDFSLSDEQFLDG
jgi:antitoxin (DNA-binding transcriptional repressor) of toxin-antitoxin stability system